MDRLSMALFDAAVDLNPHQIEAALFALQSPLSKGVILADEVGLGKTIEAGIVLCQLWAERKRRLLVICPASLRKQWALELQEKFNLPTQVLDAKVYGELQRSGRSPLAEKAVLIMSLNYANALREGKSRVWRGGAGGLVTSPDCRFRTRLRSVQSAVHAFVLPEIPESWRDAPQIAVAGNS